MVTVTFACESIPQLCSEIGKFLKEFDQTVTEDQLSFTEEQIAHAVDAVKSKKPEKKKEEKQDEPANKIPTKVVGVVNKEQVYAALQGVNSTLGLPTARNILKEFGAEKMSDLKEEFYAAFVEKCAEVTPV
jgi:Sec-independent protein translocase protein TatA